MSHLEVLTTALHCLQVCDLLEGLLSYDAVIQIYELLLRLQLLQQSHLVSF